MTVKTGSISIDAQNIMPVIKRWLYSDKDIFVRELISNGVDAITKLKLIQSLDKDEELKITLTLNKEKGTLSFEDNGIGMTQEEVEKYINQVALSGAEDFVKNYTQAEDAGIIGHFGLGFYSSFMAASHVTIDTLSYQEGAEAVRWDSEDGIAFEIKSGERSQRGTLITLHIAEDEKEFLETHRIRQVLNKYCAFMPVPIYFVDAAEEAKKNDEETAPTPINDTNPLWFKPPRECTDEEYIETYHKLFHTFDDPLFWVHLNVDYPFNLKGILYFPRIRRDFAGQEGEIKLFNRQVYVADNIKEIIPEFLLVLKGVIDCPDLPLNVSRSFLQNDGQVRKISAHIAKKVADKLTGLFKTDRPTYEKYWDDIHPFIKYGALRDSKFYEAMKDVILYKTTEDNYLTLEEYQERNQDKVEKKVIYTTDAARQEGQIVLYRNRDIDVVVMDTVIDISFLSFMEYSSNLGENTPTFVRVDADISGLEADEEADSSISQKEMEKLFRKATGLDTLEVKLQPLQDEQLNALLTEDEQTRRFADMNALYGRELGLTQQQTLVVNPKSSTIKALVQLKDEKRKELIAAQIYDLARLATRPLEKDDLRRFLKRSQDLIAALAEN